MTISFTIDDSVASRVVDAMCAIYGYSVTSGLTKAQFTKQQIALLIKEQVKDYESRLAADAARTAAIVAVSNDVQIS